MTTDMIEQFKSIPSTAAADAAKGMTSISPAIKPLQGQYTLCGRAVTVKAVPGDNTAVLRGIRAAQPGDVLVVDAQGYVDRSMIGDFFAAAAQLLGVSGLVVDGSIRDVAAITASGWPVFCRAVTSAASGKHGTGEINVPVTCGGVTVRTGDIIIGDADGVVVIPQERAAELLAAAQDKLRRDEERAVRNLASPAAAKAYLDKLLGD